MYSVSHRKWICVLGVWSSFTEAKYGYTCVDWQQNSESGRLWSQPLLYEVCVQGFEEEVCGFQSSLGSVIFEVPHPKTQKHTSKAQQCLTYNSSECFRFNLTKHLSLLQGLLGSFRGCGFNIRDSVNFEVKQPKKETAKSAERSSQCSQERGGFVWDCKSGLNPACFKYLEHQSQCWCGGVWCLPVSMCSHMCLCECLTLIPSLESKHFQAVLYPSALFDIT